MTLLGKIFTMMIFIFAIFFCALSVCVFMTQQNWKDVALREQKDVKGNDTPLGLVYQLANAEQDVEDRDGELRELQQELARERAGRAYALAALEESRQIEADLRRTAEATHAELLIAHREAASAMAATQGRLKDLTAEIASARDAIKVAQGDRDDKQERVVFLTDEVHKAEDLKRRLEERQADLVATISRMQKVLRANSLSEFEDVDGIPPSLDGLVLDVRKNFMEISLGSDDGLKVGHQLEVFKDRTYKGRIVVRRTDPDRAVAEIIPELRKGEIQKGDNVRTKVSQPMATDDLFAEALDDPADGAPLDDAAGPGQPVLAPQQARTQKPRSNVQTMMLILSLAAIVTSCVVLYLYLDQYGDYPWFELPPNVKSAISGA